MAADTDAWDGKLVQYGTMHEAIGQQQHQGRVPLKNLVDRPHFYGVGALAQLEGEATIFDGMVAVTRVGATGRLEAAEPSPLDASATLLVGAYVPSWQRHKSVHSVSSEEFDRYLANLATKSGLNASKPLVFTVEGEFSSVRLHVINGACPLHARLNKIEAPKDKQPFEAEFDKVRGRVVGVRRRRALGVDVELPNLAERATYPTESSAELFDFGRHDVYDETQGDANAPQRDARAMNVARTRSLAFAEETRSKRLELRLENPSCQKNQRVIDRQIMRRH